MKYMRKSFWNILSQMSNLMSNLIKEPKGLFSSFFTQSSKYRQYKKIWVVARAKEGWELGGGG